MNLCPVMVGREPELRQLQEALGRGGVILVAGEAGMGKTRLIREVAESANQAGFPVIWARPEVVAESGPYSLVVDLLDDVSSALEGATEALSLAETLAAPKDGVSQPSARQIAARTRGFISALGRSPVLVVEDLHAADESSQAVIAHLARSARDDGFTLIGTYRPEEARSGGTQRLLDLLLRDRLALELPLQPLSTSRVAEMLSLMWGKSPAEDELERVAGLAEGVPFFVEELGLSADANIPDSLARAAAARLSRLSNEAQFITRVAALSPGAVDPAVLAHVTGFPPERLPPLLLEAARVGLLTDREDRLVFRHALIRDALAEGIVSLERAELHRKLAAGIEFIHRDELERYSHVLAIHHRESGDPARAAECLSLAAERAAAVGAAEDTIDYLSQALALVSPSTVQHVHATVQLAEFEAKLGDSASALERLHEVARHARGVQKARVHAARGDVLLRVGDGKAQAEYLAASQALSSDAPVDVQARVALGVAQAQVMIDLTSAESSLQNALDLCRKSNRHDLLAEALIDFSGWLTGVGREGEAASLLQEAMDLAKSAKLDEVLGRAYSRRASSLALHGRCEEALRVLDEARGLLTSGFASHLAMQLDHVRVWILWRMGRPADADRIAGRLEVGGLSQGYGRVVGAWAALQQGDEERAWAIVGSWWDEIGQELRTLSAPELFELPTTPEGGPYALLAEALLVSLSDGTPTAEQLRVVSTYEEFGRAGIPDSAAVAAVLAGRVRAKVGDAEAALKLADYVHGLCLEGAGPLNQAYALEVRGIALSQMGREPEAQTCLEQASDAYRAVENVVDRVRTRRTLASIMDGPSTIPLLRECLRDAVSVGASREANLIEAALREAGVRPRAGRPRGSHGRREGLSAREEEVVALVASGATNSEIGERLFISERTVQDHIARAQRRIGAGSRAGLAAWAAKEGLI